MEFAHRRWTLGSDSDRHFFPLWDEREGTLRDQRKEVTWMHQEIELEEQKNNTKGEVCVIMHWTQSSHHLKLSYCVIVCIEMENATLRVLDWIQLYYRKWNLSNDSVVRQTGVNCYCGHNRSRYNCRVCFALHTRGLWSAVNILNWNIPKIFQCVLRLSKRLQFNWLIESDCNN